MFRKPVYSHAGRDLFWCKSVGIPPFTHCNNLPIEKRLVSLWAILCCSFQVEVGRQPQKYRRQGKKFKLLNLPSLNLDNLEMLPSRRTHGARVNLYLRLNLIFSLYISIHDLELCILGKSFTKDLRHIAYILHCCREDDELCHFLRYTGRGTMGRDMNIS